MIFFPDITVFYSCVSDTLGCLRFSSSKISLVFKKKHLLYALGPLRWTTWINIVRRNKLHRIYNNVCFIVWSLLNLSTDPQKNHCWLNSRGFRKYCEPLKLSARALRFDEDSSSIFHVLWRRTFIVFQRLRDVTQVHHVISQPNICLPKARATRTPWIIWVCGHLLFVLNFED
jgi:hypothetical protein